MRKDKNEQREACLSLVENIPQMTIIELIYVMQNVIKDSALDTEPLEQVRPFTQALAQRLQMSEEEAMWLSIFVDSFDEESISIRDLANYLDCNKTLLLCYGECFKSLADKRYIESADFEFSVNIDAVEALQNNTPYTLNDTTEVSTLEFFELLEEQFEQLSENMFRRNRKALKNIPRRIANLVERNRHLDICKKIMGYQIPASDSQMTLVLLLYFCHLLVNEKVDTFTNEEISAPIKERLQRNRIIAQFDSGEHPLFQMHLIVVANNSAQLEDGRYTLTKVAREELLSGVDIKIKEGDKVRDVISPEDITAKELFYNASESRQIEQLSSLLEQENFTQVQQRLEEGGMRKGFACLLHGAPGTGKTETVMQLARRTGRKILSVNISTIKDKWVGESEKNIQAVFDKYRTISNQMTVKPILLFNEADGVLGKRLENVARSVDQMSNSMQNIILQEMEKLEGIMIATTNLTNNLDAAFERRFLYKVEFSRPTEEAKRAIWRTMIPTLSDDATRELATRYDFSGGEIENIARKCTVERILSDTEPTLESIVELCRNEKLGNRAGARRIGY